MPSTQPNGGPYLPRPLRCPHCGAPLEAALPALLTRCGYCGHQIKLAEPSAPPPIPPRASANGALAQAPVLGVLMAVTALGGLATASFFFFAMRPRAPEATPHLQSAVSSRESAAQPALPSLPTAPPAGAPSRVGYPLRSLLGTSTLVDIDGSRTHLLGLFPTIESSRVADQLRYVVPLDHPWFSQAELSWKNEKAGKLVSVGFRPPVSKAKLENQKEIADCLARGLGKPEVRELDHLSGELSYFWGRHFPRAWADVYPAYLWLAFEDPKGVAPITFAQVVRTLDDCTPHTR